MAYKMVREAEYKQMENWILASKNISKTQDKNSTANILMEH